jgi:hypothetical protein
MRAGKTRLIISLTMAIAFTLPIVCASPAFALSTADTVGVADASGDPGTYLEVPVTITNVQNGPIISMIFDVIYNNDALSVVDVQKGALTSFWDSPTMNNFAWGTRVSVVYDGLNSHGVEDGAIGSVVLLNVSVSGEPGETSRINLTNIQFSDTTYELGTAPVKNGTFTIRAAESDTSTLSDTVEDIEWSEAYWEEDGLWHITERRSNSTSHSWWYGQETTGTYDTESANSGCLVSKTIDLTDATDATLNFWTYWQTESTSSTKWDNKMVEISADGGANWELLQQLSGSMQGDMALSLKDYVGNEVRIRFRFDTGDRYYNNYEGWFIDDVTVGEVPVPADNSMLSDNIEDIEESEVYWEEDGLWHITERRSNSTSHSWWYGLETTGTYDTGSANSGSLVSKTIDLMDATDATLNFWTYWQTESTSSTKWDNKMVEISADGGANWELLQQLSGSMQGDMALSLKDYVGNEVMIRFRFDTVDGYYNNYEGWFIDDITVSWIN